MADFSLKLTAEGMGKTLDNLGIEVERELNLATESVVHVAHANILAGLQTRADTQDQIQTYEKALEFQKIGESEYLIYLNGREANQLEDGKAAWSIKDALLASQKIVGVGSRAGNPWVRENKEGKKYAAVPFQHRPYSKKDSGSGNLAADIKRLTAMNRAGVKQKLTKVFKDLDGNPIQGKVATVTGTGIPNLEGVTKYQNIYEKTTQGLYFTFRMVSEDSTGWIHPAEKGYELFNEAEQYVEAELKNIVESIL